MQIILKPYLHFFVYYLLDILDYLLDILDYLLDILDYLLDILDYLLDILDYLLDILDYLLDILDYLLDILDYLLDILDYFTFGVFQKEYFVYFANLDVLWKIQITHCVCTRFSENLKEITMKFLLCRTVSNIYTKLMFRNMKKRL